MQLIAGDFVRLMTSESCSARPSRKKRDAYLTTEGSRTDTAVSISDLYRVQRRCQLMIISLPFSAKDCIAQAALRKAGNSRLIHDLQSVLHHQVIYSTCHRFRLS